MGGSRVTEHGLFMMSPCPYRGRISDHVYLSIDSIASMFAVLLVLAGCHWSLCVAPHVPLLLIPLPLFPPPQSECQWVSSARPRLWWSIIIMSLLSLPPETDIVTEFTGHRMHDTSHSIKVDFNGSDLFYSTDNQFTFTVHFTSQIAIVSDMKVQS